MRKNRIPKHGPIPPFTQLKQLPPEQRARIYAQTERLSLEAGRAWLQTEYGIALSSDGRLSDWRSWQVLKAALEYSNHVLEQFLAWYKELHPTATPEQIREAGLAFFMSEALVHKDEKSFALFAALSLDEQIDLKKLCQGDRKLDLEERRVRLLEQKAAQADQAKNAACDPALTPEQKAARFREIFGIK